MTLATATALGAGASVFNQIASLFGESMNRRYNEEQVDKQWSRMLEQWNRENAYNHPRQVVDRMKQANVNPALAYMNGASFAPAASSPTPGANKSQSLFQPQIDPMMAANIDLLKAQAENLRAQTKTEDETREGQVSTLAKSVESLQQTINESKQRVRNMVETLKGIKQDNEYKEWQNIFLSSSMQYMVSREKSSALLLQDQQQTFILGFLADQGLKRAETSYKDALALLTNKEASQVDFMLNMAKYMWNIDKGYYQVNAHNDYVRRYFDAKMVGELNAFWNEHKDEDWWIARITESLNTFFNGMNAGANVMAMRGRPQGSTTTYVYDNKGKKAVERKTYH